MKHSAAEIAQILLEAGAVALSPAKPFRFASGILSPVYCDNRLLLGQVSARKAVAAALAERVEGEIVSAEVIDLSTGATPDGFRLEPLRLSLP